jgi:hypothetical protein
VCDVHRPVHQGSRGLAGWRCQKWIAACGSVDGLDGVIPHLTSHKRPCLASPVPIGGKIEHSLIPSGIDFPILPVHAISVSSAESTTVGLSLG